MLRVSTHRVHNTHAGSLLSSISSPATRQFSFSAPRSKPRLVILGSGWGGYEVLRGIDKNRWSEYSSSSNLVLLLTSVMLDVTMVSPTSYFNFTPLLASCAVGTLEFRSAVEPVSKKRSPRFALFTIYPGAALYTTSRTFSSFSLLR